MFWGGSCHRKRFPAGDGGESIPFSISSVRKSRWDWKHVNVQSLDEGALSSQILTFFFPPCSSSSGPAVSMGSAIPTPMATLHDYHFSVFSSFLVSPTRSPSHLAASQSSPTTSPSGPGPQLTMGGGPSRKGRGGTRT